MTRKIDRLEVLARDLASRYGEGDALVQSLRSEIQQVQADHPTDVQPRTERRVRTQGPLGRKQPSSLHVA